jgi:putative ABC transport system permease protein
MSPADSSRLVAQAWRALGRTRGATMAAIVALAVGIGANTIVFSIVDAALLEPPPFENPSALVVLNERSPQADQMSASYLDYVDWRAANSVFDSLAVMGRETFNLTGAGDPVQVFGLHVSESLFDVLRVKPFAGRLLRADDDRPGAAPVVLLTYTSWTRRFGGDPGIIGRTITLDRIPRTVVGVLPPNFNFPTAGDRAEIYSPFGLISSDYRDRGLRVLFVVGRLKQGATIDGARADLDTIAGRLARDYPATNREVRVSVTPYRDRMVVSSRTLLLAVWGAVFAVLLVACASAATVLVTRGAGRAREFAIRTALGATRADLVRQLLTEGLLLAAVSGAVGVLLAAWGLPVFVALLPRNLPHMADFSLNAKAVLFAVAAATTTGMVTGLLPAWQASGPSLHSTASARVEPVAARPHLRAALVVGQLALSQALLVGAGLLIATLVHLLNIDPGFQPERVATGLYYLTDSTYVTHEQLAGFHRTLVDRVSRLPGVTAVGLITPPPFDFGSSESDVVIEGQDGVVRTDSFFATPGTRAALDIPLKAGRFFDDGDRDDAPRVALVDERFAKTYFGTGPVLGRRIRLSRSTSWMEVVGVVGHIATRTLDYAGKPQVYAPLLGSSLHFTAVVVRTASADPMTAMPGVRRVMRGMDPDLPLFDTAPIARQIAETAGGARLGAFTFVALAAAAWLLAAIGLAGVVGYSVTIRTRELGIRLALGARPGALVRGVVVYGTALTLAGLVVGLGAGLAGGRALSALLVGVRPVDARVLGGAGLALLATGVAASYIPARRVARVDPLEALKAD